MLKQQQQSDNNLLTRALVVGYLFPYKLYEDFSKRFAGKELSEYKPQNKKTNSRN